MDGFDADERLPGDVPPEDLEKARVDLVFATGENMKALFEALPDSRRGGWAPNAEELAQLLRDSVTPGDAVLVKGSNASRMNHVVESLKT